MSEPYIGEIRAFALDYAPAGWVACNGQLLDIGQNLNLFRVIGTTYGGDGGQSFAVPDLRGAFAIGAGERFSAKPLGAAEGASKVSLTPHQVPTHGHRLKAALSPTTGTPGPTVALAPSGNGAAAYLAPGDVVNLASTSIAPAGGTPAGAAPHENRQPFLGLTYCIAVTGMTPGTSLMAVRSANVQRTATPTRGRR